jgi:hypothetical protein
MHVNPLKRLSTAPGHRLALAVALVLILLALPLAEAWRRQGIELQATYVARRGVEPVALATRLQLTLAAHRPYAAAVLSGRAEQEPERQHRQRAVDEQLAALTTSLELQHLHRALDETDHLRAEWSRLLDEISRRQPSALASDAAHDLLVEQAYTVADLAASASRLYGQAGRAFDDTHLVLALRTLPRYGATLAATLAAHQAGGADATSWVSTAGAAGAAREAAAALQARLVTQARQVGAAAEGLLDTLDAVADASAVAPDPALVHALVAVAQSARVMARMRDGAQGEKPGEKHGETQGEAQAFDAATAQRALVASVEGAADLVTALDAGLAEAATTLQRERRILTGAGALLLLVALLAALRVLPRAQARRPVADEGAVDTSTLPLHDAQAPPKPESEGPASDLLQRLQSVQRLRRGDEVEADRPQDTR